MVILLDEIFKTFRKWRTYIGFLAIAVIVPLVLIAMKIDGENYLRHATSGIQRDFLFVGNILNAWFVTHFIMNILWIHVPFLISLVAGDILAGEATAGTFRILLIRPVSRTKIFIMKYLTSLFYSFALVVFLGVLSIGLGLILFGSGDMLILGMRGGVLILPADEAWGRFLAAFALAAAAMGSVASLALLFSSFVENAIGPIVGTMAVMIAFLVIGNLPITFFETMRPFLFTSYLDVWTKAFEDPVSLRGIGGSLLALASFSLLFSVSAWLVFTRKDITS